MAKKNKENNLLKDHMLKEKKIYKNHESFSKISGDYENSIKNKKRIQIALIILCVLIFITYVFFVFLKHRIISFDYIDECGIMPGGNGLTHTIASEDMCNNACYSYCQSKEKNLLNYEFKEELNKCNSCRCKCY
ncbi:MAG: hypothetical protein QW757_01870 [Candidatus Woesearchaeota archaeon]